MAEQSSIDDRPATFAEGIPVPVQVPDSQVAVAAAPPTTAEVYAEWNTFRAATDLFVDGSRAVPKGGKVPASHPMIPEWAANGQLERVDGQALGQAAPSPSPASPNPRKGRERDA